MRFQTVLLAALFLAACGARDFGAMSQERRLAEGSALLLQACINSSDAHGVSFFGRLDIGRGRAYFDYVAANVRPGELDLYINGEALGMCLEAEGWRRHLQRLILRVGSDQHVDAVVQSVTSPSRWCDGELSRYFEPQEVERVVAACDRLGLRENSPVDRVNLAP